MFEFGKDLKRLFAHSREEDDLGWLELIGVPMLESEARRWSAEAGRVSCRRPRQAALRAATVWREHARRTGSAASIVRALELTEDAGRDAGDGDELAEARLEAALTVMVDHDLRGGSERLARASSLLEVAHTGRGAALRARVAAAEARLSARAPSNNANAAADLLDTAIHGLEARADTRNEATEARLVRAALALDHGMRMPDPLLLDQAGAELRTLVDLASPDYLPLTRARALTLCAAGLGKLAQMAGSEAAHGQARAMFEAASDSFTPDHSPLDWVAVQLARLGAGRPVDLSALMQAEMLTMGEGLVLGALARDARTAAEVRIAEAAANGVALDAIEVRLRRRLATENAALSPLDWAADQIGLGEVSRARRHLYGVAVPPALRLALMEAAEVARLEGVDGLAIRADTLGAALAPA